MRVIHLPFTFYPDPIGGTEVYVETLAQQQQRSGMNVTVAAPSDTEQCYVYRGLNVCRFPVNNAVGDVHELYGEGDRAAAACFGRLLDREQPDVVHLHAFTRGVSVGTVLEAKRRNIPVVFNYHTPTVSCQRGSLMRWGAEMCDGVVDVSRCSECTLHSLGLARPLAWAIARLPRSLSRVAHAANLHGAGTAIRMRELMAARHAALRSLLAHVDHVVVLCDWARLILLRNGVPADKMSFSRQGLPVADVTRPRPSRDARGSRHPLRVAFFGRLDVTKGVHVLIAALKRAPRLDVALDIYGISQGDSGADYFKRLQRLVAGDARVRFLEPVHPSEVVSTMAGYDLVAVPSQSLETGPLVVMEAFAAKVPVIGSNLGGIAELVADGVNGLLVEPRSIEAWRGALEGVCRKPRTLMSLRAHIPRPRSVIHVAQDMSTVYSRLIRSRTLSGPLVRAAQSNLSASVSLSVL